MFTIVQFSPTGNTAHVAKLLSDQLDTNNLYALEHTIPSELPNTEHLIILFAIHAFNAPRTVKRFVKMMPSNKFKKVSLIAVGCNTSWVNNAASKEIRKILASKSYNIVVDDIIAMPLTFIMSFPEDVIKDQIDSAHKVIEKLSSDIINSVVSKKQISLKSHVIHGIGRVEPFASRFFGLELHAKKSCIKCGLCVKECPEQNIQMKDNGKLKFGFKCMMCMRCLYNCPTKSITPRISKFIPIKKGYSLNDYLSGEEKEE